MMCPRAPAKKRPAAQVGRGDVDMRLNLAPRRTGGFLAAGPAPGGRYFPPAPLVMLGTMSPVETACTASRKMLS